MSVGSDGGQIDNNNADSSLNNAAPEEPKPEFQLQISRDNMVAYLRVKLARPDQTITFDEVIEFLKKSVITYGICEEAIRTFCKNNKFFSELICAKGIPPVNGIDGSIEYTFNKDTNFEPKQREDGTVDFRDLDLVKNIAKGESLCHITPATPGVDGMDVYNHVVPFLPGKLPVLPTGSNTTASEDGLNLTANVDGCIEFTRSAINVNEVFYVRGDVDISSGNINAIGSVVIQGDVREGFIVKAGKDVSIRGMVEGATIEAKGSISISKGMSGMGKGTLLAGGNIKGKYFENAILFSENDIYSDTLMNCRVKAGGSILLKGQKASLMGGSYQAAQRIFAKNIGTPSNTITTVSISSEELNAMLVADKAEFSIPQLEGKLVEAQSALQEYQEQFTNLTKQLAMSGKSSTQTGSLLMKSAITKKGKLTEEVELLKAEIKKVSEVNTNLIDYKIVGAGIVYSGTKIIIGPYTINVNQDNSNTKFYVNTGEIVFAPVLPSDME